MNDPYTTPSLEQRLHQPHDVESHGLRTARIAVAVATMMQLDTDTISTIALASRVHDIGKTHIDPLLLDKPGPLTSKEWVEMRKHPQIGYDMVKGWVDEKIARVVLAHHERLDGTGYPNKLTAPDIDLPTRVVHVADAFDAITSARPYQPALPVDHAVSELAANVGTQFDGDCVEALVAVVEHNRIALTSPVGVTAAMGFAAVAG